MAPPPQRTNWLKILLLAFGTLVGMAALGYLIQVLGLVRTEPAPPDAPAAAESPLSTAEE